MIPRGARPALVAAVAVTVAIALGGCTAARDDPTIEAPSGAAASRSLPVPSAAPSVASRSRALQELARFDDVNRSTAKRRDPGGRAFIDALVAAGFRRSDMQVTEDRTTIGLAVPSVQFSVLWRGVCLVGQHGDGSGGYRSAAVDPVEGRCLIGKTRPIDW